MKPAIFVFLVLFILIHSDSNLHSRIPQGEGPRIIRFSGFDWIVARSGNRMMPPGPNHFSGSAQNVWVDPSGRLHLKITRYNGRWESAGVILRGAVSYGRYAFRVSTDVDKLNEHVVAGLFLYRDDRNEADIEFSRWGDRAAVAGQYVIQPWERDGNRHRFSIENIGERSTHLIDWQPESVTFSSYRGHGITPEPQDMVSEWTYRGEDIPAGNRVKLMINLWLYQGTPPSDGQDAELVIERISCRPSGPGKRYW
ncbi:MAG TPA: hypothetical protein ENO20_10825 [Bacteroides sp.]|nr:hypothetical protein [Bacteroides sp.]